MSAHPPSSPRIQRQVVVSACFGTFLEWYDFLTFASLATWFGSLFFPATDPVAALLRNTALWDAVDGEVASAVQSLATNTVFLDALSAGIAVE